MKFRLFALLILIFVPLIAAGSSPCEQKRERISSVLQEGSASLRRSVDQIQSTLHLSQDTKESFQHNAQWVIAWSQDQHAQMDRKECEELDDLMNNIRVQWTPLQLALFTLRAKVTLWYIDQLLGEEITGSDFAALEEAAKLLRSVADAESFGEAKFAMRRAAFLARTALRSVRKTVTID